MRPLVLLGPQRPDPNLRGPLDEAGCDGPCVLITAGWRGDEAEDAALRSHIGRPATALPLYRWFEAASVDAPDVAASWTRRQERLRALKRVHRLRLTPALEAWSELVRAEDDRAIVDRELERALRAVRQVDTDLLEETAAIEAEHSELARPWEDARLRSRHEAVCEALDGAGALLIAGGHVGVLMNRIRFFGVDVAAAARPDLLVAAWSAGLMALTDRIVLFYDDPPEGAAWPEVFGPGLGWLPGLVALPHARRRLRLSEPGRVGLLARRFHPAVCVGLENGAHLVLKDDRWVNVGVTETAFQLDGSGAVRGLS